ncbi:serine kinase [Dyadobacter crusticola]|uniref:serine kinase n=1 Tax=Dyadobacter crusticola TaxID=292407 RepID=UPI0004E0E44A|nr:serine kinase [Dyadobacter crusticola]
MHYYKAFGLTVFSEIPLPELSEGDCNASPDLLIRTAAFELPDLSKTQVYRRGIRALFGENAGDLVLHWPGIASFKAIAGNELIVNPFVKDPNLISLFTVSEAIGLILFQRGLLLLHASSVLVGAEAWCFMGTPGAGKSTTAAAFIKAGGRLLSDDLTAIQIGENGSISVLPAYPQLKIWDKTVAGLQYNREVLEPVSEGVNKFSFQPKFDFPDQPVTLSKIIFLHRARNRGALQQVSVSEMPGELIKNFPLPAQLLTGEALKAHFLQSMKCAAQVEVIKKRRPEGFDLLEKWVQESVTHLV